MVGGHHLLYHLGLGERPEGSFSEQWAHAEVTNLQMGAGMALGHALSSGRLLVLEKNLDLSLPLRSPLFSTKTFQRDFVSASEENFRFFHGWTKTPWKLYRFP
jgi:hypothetical protein